MLQKLFNLHEKRALVTGSSRGIGYAAAMALAEAGAHVIFHASKPSERLDAALAEARRRGFSCEAVAADISMKEGLEHLISATVAVDILVLNASAQVYMTVEEFDAAEFDREYHTNVKASFELVRAFLPGMRERRFGRIIALGSVNQYRPSPRLCLYASTKAAQANFILGLARANAKFGITANNVAPGVIDTDRNSAVLSKAESAEEIRKLIPAGRFGKAEDCAGLILLLASDAGSYITGEDITVDGGMHL
jgi:NAD(P)-dependent dehydrogenase (short-subunit alcohol dehydrogenase family)